MGRTLVREIIAAHSTQEAAEGEICRVKVDFAFANDITGAPAAASFREMGAEKVFDGERCAFARPFHPNKILPRRTDRRAGSSPWNRECCTGKWAGWALSTLSSPKKATSFPAT